MHRRDLSTEILSDAVLRYAVDRMRLDPPPLDQPRSAAELAARVGETITAQGLGGQRALALFTDVLAPACISIDHPRFLAFVPGAPTEAAILFDLVVGASSIYAGSWMEGAGAVYAENQALAWIARTAGLPAGVGGVFVSGGTAGNLSALVAARHRWREADPRRATVRAAIACSSEAHSSIAAAARVIDADLVVVPGDEVGRVHGAALAATLDALDEATRSRLCAVVATAGTTNVGVVDDLAGVAEVAARRGIWFHVDAAYGGAALLAPATRPLFEGIDRCDSLIVDPHKWLFAPYDSCALIYRDPLAARRAHTQHAEYLAVLHGGGPEHDGGDRRGAGNEHELPWNPSDFAVHLSRRARGLPLWFSLAVHGTDAYRRAVEACLALAVRTAALVRSLDHLELCLDPELSVVVFRRRGWTAADYRTWCDRALSDQLGFVVPSAWRGEPVLRLCFVNPRTTIDDVSVLLDSMR